MCNCGEFELPHARSVAASLGWEGVGETNCAAVPGCAALMGRAVDLGCRPFYCPVGRGGCARGREQGVVKAAPLPPRTRRAGECAAEPKLAHQSLRGPRPKVVSAERPPLGSRWSVEGSRVAVGGRWCTSCCARGLLCCYGLLCSVTVPHAVVPMLYDCFPTVPQPELPLTRGGGVDRLRIRTSRVAPSARSVGFGKPRAGRDDRVRRCCTWGIGPFIGRACHRACKGGVWGMAANVSL